MKITVTLDIELDKTFLPLDEDDLLWFENEVMIGDGSLILHSNTVGDSVGVVKRVAWVDRIPHPDLVFLIDHIETGEQYPEPRSE